MGVPTHLRGLAIRVNKALVPVVWGKQRPYYYSLQRDVGRCRLLLAVFSGEGGVNAIRFVDFKGEDVSVVISYCVGCR